MMTMVVVMKTMMIRNSQVLSELIVASSRALISRRTNIHRLTLDRLGND